MVVDTCDTSGLENHPREATDYGSVTECWPCEDSPWSVCDSVTLSAVMNDSYHACVDDVDIYDASSRTGMCMITDDL